MGKFSDIATWVFLAAIVVLAVCIVVLYTQAIIALYAVNPVISIALASVIIAVLSVLAVRYLP